MPADTSPFLAPPKRGFFFGRSGPEFPIGTFRLKSTVIERSATDGVVGADPLGERHPKPQSPLSPFLGVRNLAKKVTVCQEPYEPLCVAWQGAGDLHNAKF
jgi:hypothetical protein